MLNHNIRRTRILRIVLLCANTEQRCASAPSDRRSLFSFYYYSHDLWDGSEWMLHKRSRAYITLDSIAVHTIFNAVTLSLFCSVGLCWRSFFSSRFHLYSRLPINRRLSSSLQFSFRLYCHIALVLWTEIAKQRRRRLLLFLTFNGHELITRTIMCANERARAFERSWSQARSTWIFVAWFTIMKNYFTTFFGTHNHHTRTHGHIFGGWNSTIAFEPTLSLPLFDGSMVDSR